MLTKIFMTTQAAEGKIIDFNKKKMLNQILIHAIWITWSVRRMILSEGIVYIKFLFFLTWGVCTYEKLVFSTEQDHMLLHFSRSCVHFCVSHNLGLPCHGISLSSKDNFISFFNCRWVIMLLKIIPMAQKVKKKYNVRSRNIYKN